MASGDPGGDEAATVFVSYSHVDEAWKDRLVKHLRVLELEGDLDVWEDRRIEGGAEWYADIGTALQKARVAVLLITADFLTSRFIREEELTKILARRAEQSLIVLPVIVKPCTWQSIDWLRQIQLRPKDGRPLSGGTDHQIDVDLAELAAEVQRLIHPSEQHSGRVATPRAQAEIEPRSFVGRLLPSEYWVLVPTLLVPLAVLISLVVHVPTRVQVDAVVSRVTFNVSGAERRDFLNPSAEIVSLTAEGCASVNFDADRVIALDGREIRSGPQRIVCADPAAKVSLRGVGAGAAAIGSLGRLSVAPGTPVVLSARRDPCSNDLSAAGGECPVVTLELAQPPRLSPQIRPDVTEVELTTDLAPLEQDPRASGDLNRYRVQLTASNRFLALEGRDRGVTLVLTLPPHGQNLFAKPLDLHVESLEFLDLNSEGRLVSSLIAEASLSYPDVAAVGQVAIASGDAIGLEGLEGVRLREMGLGSATKGLELRVDGVARRIVTGSGDFTTDRRLTGFQYLRYRGGWLWLVVAWGVLTGIAFVTGRRRRI